MTSDPTEINETMANNPTYSRPSTPALNTSLHSDLSSSSYSDTSSDTVSRSSQTTNQTAQETLPPPHSDATGAGSPELSSAERSNTEDMSNLEDPDSTCIINSTKEEEEEEEEEEEKKSSEPKEISNWTLKLYEALNDSAISTTVLFSSFTGSAALAYLTHQYRIGKLSGLLTIGVVSGVVALGAAEYFSVKGYIRKNTPKE